MNKMQLRMIIVIALSFDIILKPLLQTVQEFVSFLLGANLLLHILLIISFLGITWKRKSSDLGALKAGRIMLILYIVLLAIDALLYIVGILNGGGSWILGSLFILHSPILFFIFLSPPTVLMYLDLRLSESSGIYSSLSDSALALLIWLVLIVIAQGVTGVTIIFY